MSKRPIGNCVFKDRWCIFLVFQLIIILRRWRADLVLWSVNFLNIVHQFYIQLFKKSFKNYWFPRQVLARFCDASARVRIDWRPSLEAQRGLFIVLPIFIIPEFELVFAYWCFWIIKFWLSELWLVEAGMDSSYNRILSSALQGRFLVLYSLYTKILTSRWLLVFSNYKI